MDKNKNYVIGRSLTKARKGRELSKFGYTLEKESMESIVDFPISKIYYPDVIRLLGLFDTIFKTFKAEIDTIKGVYTFNEKNYTRIDEVDDNEPVEALFIAHYGESADPRVFLMLTPFNAALCINDKYGVPFGFYEDVSRILSKNRRLLHHFYGMNFDYAIVLAVTSIFTAAGLGADKSLLASMSAVFLLVLSSIYALIFYAKRSYYKIYLYEASNNKCSLGKVYTRYVARMFEALQMVFR
jgi:hypothetical protein